MMQPDFFSLTAPPVQQQAKPKFVEGTLCQLAKTLYEIHTAHEAQPSAAVQEAVQRLSGDPDRKTIVNDANAVVVSLTRKAQKLLVTAASPAPNVFGQAVIMKQATVAALQKDLEKFTALADLATDQEQKSQVDMERLRAEAYIKKVQQQIVDVDYTREEIEQARLRIQKIKDMESLSVDESENTILQMSKIWHQLVQAILLCKLTSKQTGHGPVSFKDTPTASMEPIATFARSESGKLNRLSLETGETVRSFAARCKEQERYCSWLREL